MDPFEPPAVDVDFALAQQQHASRFIRTAIGAVAVALFGWLCDPFFVVSIAAVGLGLNAIREPRWLRIADEQAYPAAAGRLATIAGWVAVGLTVFKFVFTVLVLAL